MNNERDDVSDSTSLSRDAVAKVLDRIATLDRDGADALSVEELRRSALEAGMSETAIEQALSEHFDLAEAEPSWTEHPMLPSLGYGTVGIVIGMLITLGSSTLISLGLWGALLVSVQLLWRHFGRGDFGRLVRETAVLWALYLGTLIVLTGGSVQIFALPALAMAVTATLGFFTTRPGGEPDSLPPVQGEEGSDRNLIGSG